MSVSSVVSLESCRVGAGSIQILVLCEAVLIRQLLQVQTVHGWEVQLA
jgi:hypothetical protein